MTVNKDLENEPAKSIFESYTKLNIKPEKSDERGMKVKINEIEQNLIPESNTESISLSRGSFKDNNTTIKESEKNISEIDRLKNDFNKLLNESKNMKLENDKLEQRSRLMKDSIQNKTSNNLISFN